MTISIPGGWTPVPHRLLDVMARPGGAARIQLYLLVGRHGTAGGGNGCWASVTTLAGASGLAPRTVRYVLADLVAGGWISQERRPGSTTIYRACFVPQAGALDPGQPGAGVGGSAAMRDRGDCLGDRQPGAGVGVGAATRDRGDCLGVRQSGAGVGEGAATRGRGDCLGGRQPGADEKELNIKTSSSNSLKSLYVSAAGQARSEIQRGKDQGEEEQPQPAPPAPFEPSEPKSQDELLWERAVAANFVPLTPPPDRPEWPTPPEPLYRNWGWQHQKLVHLAAQAYKGTPGAPEDPFWQIVKANPDYAYPWPYGTGRLEPPPPRRPKPVPPPPPVTTQLPVTTGELPQQLQPIADRIEDYWTAKGGPRTAGAFRALVEELELAVRGAGHSGARELLRQAMQAGWPALNAELWLAQRRRESDLNAHPAYQAFRAS